MKPSAAPRRFPYAEHRNMAQVMQREAICAKVRQARVAAQFGMEVEAAE